MSEIGEDLDIEQDNGQEEIALKNEVLTLPDRGQIISIQTILIGISEFLAQNGQVKQRNIIKIRPGSK